MSKLTPAERAILIGQYQILAAIEGDEEKYKDVIEVLSVGYELDYEEHVDGLSDPLYEDDCKFVRDILLLYYLMKLARNKDTADVDAQGRRRFESVDPKFPGFDGNNQPRLLRYAKFLIEQQGQYPEHRHYLNSHGSQPDYESMIAKWEGWGRPTELTPAQVDELLAR